MNFITHNHIAEFAALLCSSIFFKSIQKTKLKTLPFFLIFILLVELLGSYLIRVKNLSNLWLYNMSIPVEYSYYLYLLLIHSQSQFKKFIAFFIGIFLLIAGLYFIKEPLFVFHTNVLIVGQTLVILSVCFYIYELFQSDAELPLLKNYFFWIMSGLFLFNLGDIVYFILYPTIHKYHWDQFDYLFISINNSLLILLYFTYIVSIIVLNKYYRR